MMTPARILRTNLIRYLRLQRLKRTGWDLSEMRDTFRRAAALTGLLAASFAITTGAAAQAPTDAQRAAIKSQCRSDYIAHCSSIAPGGAASLQCLQKNMASLATGCQAAVQAVTGGAAAQSEPNAEPAKTESKPATAVAPAAAEAKIEGKTENKTESKPETAAAPASAAPATAPPSKSGGRKKPSNA